MATPTRETSRLLALGESLRENPATIIFSFPVLTASIIYFSLLRNNDHLAGAFGHLGLAFKLYHKHHFSHPLLLKIAYHLFDRALSLGNSDSQPTVLMKMGSISEELGQFSRAESDFLRAIDLALAQSDKPQAAYAKSHLGSLYITMSKFQDAKILLDESFKTLRQAVKADPAPRLHVWLCGVELALAKWHQTTGDITKAKSWALQASRQADQNNLKTRQLDATKLLESLSTN